jgi:hypothetical protein
MQQRSSDSSSIVTREMRRRLRHWLRLGLATVALAYAIDPEWPVHLRRLVLILQTIFGRSNGYVLQWLLR